MHLTAIITARGGSKRIPKKNIKNFMGKPMLCYAIDICRESDLFEEIMVSTDDDEIAEIARRYGAAVPFMRSEKTADDHATTADVLDEVINEYRKIGRIFDEFCCMYPCVPLLNATILKQAYEKFKKSHADMLLPVVRFSFPIQRALRINAEGCLEYREPENASKRSQDLEPMFHDVGMFYFHKTVKNDPLKCVPFEIDEKYVQDIDNISDWEIAELKYQIINNYKKHPTENL